MSISDHDFSTMAICSVRYCLGRHTYMPETVADIIIKHKECVDLRDRRIVIKDIEEYRGRVGFSEVDEPTWKKLQEELRGE